jgi:hypothetical protein
MRAEMDNPSVEYRGYTIVPKPESGTDGVWFGGYEIQKDGVPISSRSGLAPPFLYREAASNDSIEHAKLEIDSRISESELP